MYRFVKRFLDVILSAVALVVLLPILLIVSVALCVESPGGPIFAQTRIGRGGKPFTVYKLRTMRKEAPSSVATGELQDAKTYITKMGAFLRRTSLDELPQLLNILRGEMSVVGPRPLVPEEAGVHEERMRRGVYAVRPGMTGWAQINGRDTVNAGKKAEMDEYYAKNLSFGLDVRIVLRTVGYVCTGAGVQEGASAVEGEETEGKETYAQADDH